MLSHAAPPAAPPDGATKRTGRVLEEIAQLLVRDLAPREFFAEYLQRVASTLRGVAAAVYTAAGLGQFHVEYQINRSEVGLEQVPNGRACHAELLKQASSRLEPLWAPPHSGPDMAGDRVAAANLSNYGLLLAPVLIEGEAVGVVEVWQDFYHDAQGWRIAARFLAEAAGFAAAFLHKTRVRELRKRQQEWVRLDAFARRLHGSLLPREVACLAANEGRQLLGCDQISICANAGGRTRVLAVSGATHVEESGRLARATAELCESVLAWGERLVYRGTRDETLPPAVLRALDAYLAESNGRMLVVRPLTDERGGPHRACLLAEWFAEPVAFEDIEPALEAVAPHAATALRNALEHAAVPLGRLARPIAKARDWLRRRGKVRLALWLALAAAPVVALCVVPAPYRVEARGQMLPTGRQIVFAPVTGRIVEVKGHDGDQVARGQELLFIEDNETQLKLEQLAIRISAAEHRLAVLNDQTGKGLATEEREALAKERIGQEYELRKALAERAVLQQAGRNPKRTPVASPLAGKVVTFDTREGLVGRTVKPGEALLRVAQPRGPWEVELHVPEGDVGQVREGLHRGGGAVEVDLLLSSEPTHSYKGRLRREGLGGEATVKNNVPGVPARVEIVDPDLLGQLESLPVGVEVRARIHCGERSVGYVWFHDLLEFFYDHVLF
jgi:multidrug efflux pump subunit AcrA (membrane-fusion protein)